MTKVTKIAAVLAIALVGTTSTGFAADWNGFYVGGSVGMGTYSADFNDKYDWYDNEGLNGDTDTAANFGVHAGFNFHRDSLVLGVELAYTSHSAESTGEAWPGWSSYSGGYQTAELESTISLRLRAGLAAGNTLVYVAAGPTWAETKYTAHNGYTEYWNSVPNIASDKSRTMGITAAIGLEHKFTDAISARLQLEQTSFEESGDAVERWDPDYRFSHTDQLSNVSLGVSYNF